MTISTMFRNIMILAVFVAIFVVANSATADAATKKFTGKYFYGMKNSAEVVQLQKFLTDQGYYSGPVTGNYLNMTASAVSAFQKAQGIEAVGVFGPVTRAKANAIIDSGMIGGTSLSIIQPIIGNIETGQTQQVKWSSQNYSSKDVSVRLIRKVASNPNRYEIVRTIAENTSNDGNATWVPSSTDVGNDLVLEIGCKDSTISCRSAVSIGTNLAVIKSNRYSNTASAFQAIESANNR